MKMSKRKVIIKLIVALLLLVVVENIVLPNKVNAGFWNYLGEAALDLADSILQFIMYIGDVIVVAMQKLMLGSMEQNGEALPIDAIEKSNIFYSPAIIFSNKVAGLQIDFFDPKSQFEYTAMYDTSMERKADETYSEYTTRIAVANSRYIRGQLPFEQPKVELLENWGLAMAYEEFDWKTNPETGTGLVGKDDEYFYKGPSDFGKEIERDIDCDMGGATDFFERADYYLYGEIMADFFHEYNKRLYNIELTHNKNRADGLWKYNAVNRFATYFLSDVDDVINCYQVHKGEKYDEVKNSDESSEYKIKYYMKDIYGRTYASKEITVKESSRGAILSYSDTEFIEKLKSYEKQLLLNMADAKKCSDNYIGIKKEIKKRSNNKYITLYDVDVVEGKDVIFNCGSIYKDNKLRYDERLYGIGRLEFYETDNETLKLDAGLAYYHLFCFILWDTDYLSLLKSLNYEEPWIAEYEWKEYMHKVDGKVKMDGKGFDIMAKATIGDDAYEKLVEYFNGYMRQFSYEDYIRWLERKEIDPVQLYSWCENRTKPEFDKEKRRNIIKNAAEKYRDRAGVKAQSNQELDDYWNQNQDKYYESEYYDEYEYTYQSYNTEDLYKKFAYAIKLNEENEWINMNNIVRTKKGYYDSSNGKHFTMLTKPNDSTDASEITDASIIDKSKVFKSAIISTREDYGSPTFKYSRRFASTKFFKYFTTHGEKNLGRWMQYHILDSNPGTGGLYIKFNNFEKVNPGISGEFTEIGDEVVGFPISYFWKESLIAENNRIVDVNYWLEHTDNGDYMYYAVNTNYINLSFKVGSDEGEYVKKLIDNDELDRQELGIDSVAVFYGKIDEISDDEISDDENKLLQLSLIAIGDATNKNNMKNNGQGNYWYGNAESAYKINEISNVFESEYKDTVISSLLSGADKEKIYHVAVSNVKIFRAPAIGGTMPIKLKAKTNIAYTLKSTIASWYNGLRILALVALLSIILYTGIKIIINSASQQNKAKYKAMLKDWLVAICILFLLHYIMYFMIVVSDKLIDIINLRNDSNLLYPDQLMGKVRDLAKNSYDGEIKNSTSTNVGMGIVYIALIFLTITFTFQYVKRVVYMAFLTMIAPLIAITYPLDKMKDGKAQAFSAWLKAYIINCIIQPVHLLLYTVFVSLAIDFATENPLYSIMVIAFMLPAEKIIKEMFGLREQTGATGGIGALAGGAMVSSALQKGMGKVGNWANSKGENTKGNAANSAQADNYRNANSSEPLQSGSSSGRRGAGGSGAGGSGAGGSGAGGSGAGGSGKRGAGAKENNKSSSGKGKGNKSTSTKQKGGAKGKNNISGVNNLGTHGKKLAKAGGGAFLGTATGLAMLAANIADGDLFEDPKKAAKEVAAGTVVGYKAGENLVDKAQSFSDSLGNSGDKVKSPKEGKRNARNEAFFKTVEYKKLAENKKIQKLCKSKGKTLEEMSTEFLDNGVKDVAIIEKCLENGILGKEYSVLESAKIEDLEKYSILKERFANFSPEQIATRMLIAKNLPKNLDTKDTLQFRLFARNYGIADEAEAEKLRKDINYFI